MRSLTGIARQTQCLTRQPQCVPALAGLGTPQLPAGRPVGGSALDALEDLLAPTWLAVPKSKTTRSKKRMRAANKGLKNKLNITTCTCPDGTVKHKLRHHVCDCGEDGPVVDWNIRSPMDGVKDGLATAGAGAAEGDT
eukprot:g219.t1